MPGVLTFALYAPIGAMGDAVSGNFRSGWSRPAASAIRGMVAGCLGLTREDDQQHQALERDVGMAMLVERSGLAFVDFHTIRAPWGTKSFPTRAAELASLKERYNDPIISNREYRVDIAVLVALWLRHEGRFKLETIQKALREPVFVPYFGRKSCPLGLPMAPRIEDAENAIVALSNRLRTGPERSTLDALRGQKETPYVSMDRADVPPGIDARVEVRADAVISRSRWQFGRREEVMIPLSV